MMQKLLQNQSDYPSGITGDRSLRLLPTGLSNRFIDLGNKCDVDESDVLQYLGDDPTVNVIAFHLEDIKDSPRFLRVAKQVIQRKPVLILKPGRTKEGAKLLASHTGSLAGDDQVFDALCKQVGIIRVDKWTELVDFAKILAHQPLPKGNRLGIFSASGGGAVMTADAAIQHGLILATLTSESSKNLHKLFPPAWGANPIDFGPPATNVGPEGWLSLFQESLGILVADDNVDCIAIMTGVDAFGASLEPTITLYESIKCTSLKPVTTWVYGPIPAHVTEITRRLESLGFPVYSDLETAIKDVERLFDYIIEKEDVC